MITIIDAVMGVGKTTKVIEDVSRNQNHKYIILTPYLNEVTRYKNEIISKRSDIVALEEGLANKKERFIDAVKSGQTVIATHELFARFNEIELQHLGNLKGYKLIIDETIELVETGNIVSGDLRLLEQGGFIKSREHPEIQGLNYYDTTDAGREAEHILGDEVCSTLNFVRGKHVYAVDTHHVVFVVPPDKLMAFKDVTIMTYMFDGSDTNAWLNVFGLQFEHKELYKGNSGSLAVKEHDGHYTGKAFKELIVVHDNVKANEVGKKKARAKGEPLGRNWFLQGKNQSGVDSLRKSTRNYFKGSNAKRDDMLWTCFKDDIDSLRHPEFALKKKGDTPDTWLASNTRGTNDYANRHTLAFLINVNPPPELVKFFDKQNARFNRDQYALSRLLQWTWRSAIRNEKQIRIYLPSERMRKLLDRWLMDPLLQILTK